MEYNYSVNSIDALPSVAEEIKNIIEQNNINIVLFTGDMGAGKTTFIKELCATMGVVDVVTSPTFALINEYSTGGGKPIYHFDIYRLDSLDEVIDLGYEEYVYSGNLCFIEWWQKMEPLIPQTTEHGINIAEFKIIAVTPTSREITFTVM